MKSGSGRCPTPRMPSETTGPAGRGGQARAAPGGRSMARGGPAHLIAPGSGGGLTVRYTFLRQQQERGEVTRGPHLGSPLLPTAGQEASQRGLSGGHRPRSRPSGLRPQPGRLRVAGGPGKTGLLGPRRDVLSPCSGAGSFSSPGSSHLWSPPGQAGPGSRSRRPPPGCGIAAGEPSPEQMAESRRVGRSRRGRWSAPQGPFPLHKHINHN